MAKPPILDVTYFTKLTEIVKPYFQENGIELNFDNYDQTVQSYINMNIDNLKEVEELAIEFNAWAEYFSDLVNLTSKLYLDSETDKKSAFVEASIRMDSKKVSNGDRLAGKEKDVILARKKRNAFQSFQYALTEKREFAIRCHHHCKSICSIINTNNNQG